MTLIADGFLAGSLMTLLLPVALLVALVYWYLNFLRRVPETDEREGATDASNPGPAAAAAPSAGQDAAPSANPGAAGPGGAAPPETSHTAGEG